MNILKLTAIIGLFLISNISNASFCDDNPNDLMCQSGLGELTGGLFGSSDNKSNEVSESNNSASGDSFCDDNPNDLLCQSGLSGLGDSLSTDGLSLDSLENSLNKLGSNIESKINNVSSELVNFGEGFFEGALETVSEFLGNGEIYGLTKKLLGHIVKSNYHYVKALDIQIDAETEKDFAKCLGDKFCSSGSMDRIISLSPKIIAEIERVNKNSEKLSAKALEELEKGNIETSLAWSEGAVVLAQFAIAAQTASASCSVAANSDDQLTQIIGGVACIGSITVIADITGSVNKFYTAIKTRGESKDLYELSKNNGIQPPQESGPS